MDTALQKIKRMKNFKELGKTEQIALYQKVDRLKSLLAEKGLSYTREGINQLTPIATPQERKVIREGIKSKDALILSVQKAAVKESGRYKGSLEPEDVIQYALLGATHAMTKFKPETGAKYSSYAHFWIVQKVREAVSFEDNIRIPQKVKEGHFKLAELQGDERKKYEKTRYKYASWDEYSNPESGFVERENTMNKDSMVDLILNNLSEDKRAYLERKLGLTSETRNEMPLLSVLSLKNWDSNKWQDIEKLEAELYDECREIIEANN